MLRALLTLALIFESRAVDVTIHADVVSTRAQGPEWMNTYDIYAQVPYPANIYALFGNEAHAMTLPPSYQVTSPVKNDVGVPPQFLLTVAPELELDSFVTVGEDTNDNVASVGIDWSKWSAQNPITVSDGAVFFIDPTIAPYGTVRLGRLTTAPTESITMTIQGKTGKIERMTHREATWSKIVTLQLQRVNLPIREGNHL